MGPASRSEKEAVMALDALGLPMPPELQDKIVKKSKKGPIGALIVRKMSGVENNVAKQQTRQFEQNTAGKADIIEKLEAADAEKALSDGDRRLLDLLRTSRGSKRLAHLIAEAKTEPLGVMKAYARGCVALGQVQAAIEAHSRLPALAKDIFRHALDQTIVCEKCVGSGKIAAHKNGESVVMESKICPPCQGSGVTLKASKHKQWAAKVALEMTGQIKGPGGPTVNVQQNVAVAPGSAIGFMENILKMSDKILFDPRPSGEEVVEAEVVS
jgi:hypothetical protein